MTTRRCFQGDPGVVRGERGEDRLLPARAEPLCGSDRGAPPGRCVAKIKAPFPPAGGGGRAEGGVGCLEQEWVAARCGEAAAWHQPVASPCMAKESGLASGKGILAGVGFCPGC